jgi:hypothetical protein
MRMLALGRIDLALSAWISILPASAQRRAGTLPPSNGSRP